MSDQNTNDSDQLLQILDDSPIGVNIVGADGVRKYANAKILEMNGLGKNDINKLSVSKSYADKEVRDALLNEYEEVGFVNDREVEMVRVDGTHYWVLLSLRHIDFESEKSIIGWQYEITDRVEMENKLRDSQRLLEEQILNLRDREERLEAQAAELVNIAEELSIAEDKMKFLANHDALTGLASLRLCKDRIVLAIASADREKLKCALMFIDLDGFKSVNDTLGHDAGDAVLKEVATRTKKIIRKVDTAARIGGDEFVVVMTNIKSESEAGTVAKRLIADLARKFQIDNESVSIGASIGISLYPDNADNPDELLKMADEAMYEVKRKGKNNFGFKAKD